MPIVLFVLHYYLYFSVPILYYIKAVLKFIRVMYNNMRVRVLKFTILVMVI